MNQAASLHNWSFWRRFKAVPKFQKFRYAMITVLPCFFGAVSHFAWFGR